MSTVEKSIDVDVPVRTAYNQWTQFESFPQFMEGVDRIDQTSDTMTHWLTSIGGVTREFDAEITEQHPDERIAWTSVDGPKHAGVVTFHRLSPDKTRVMLQMDFEPEGLVENVGDKLGIVGRRVTGDLERVDPLEEVRGDRLAGQPEDQVDQVAAVPDLGQPVLGRLLVAPEPRCGQHVQRPRHVLLVQREVGVVLGPGAAAGVHRPAAAERERDLRPLELHRRLLHGLQQVGVGRRHRRGRRRVGGGLERAHSFERYPSRRTGTPPD